MGKRIECDKSLWFKTSEFLPFEDNVFLDKVPLFIEIHNAKDEKDFSYLEENKDICEKQQQSYNNSKDKLEFCQTETKKSKKIDFHKVLYSICDTGNGTKELHYFCKLGELCEYIEKKYKNRHISSEGKTLKKNRRIERKIYDVDIVNDTLVFRFYQYFTKFFQEGNIRGYNEIFRICFRGFESWGENRETLYHYDNKYICEMKKLNFYTEYRCIDEGKAIKNILSIYPDVSAYGDIFSNAKYIMNDNSCKRTNMNSKDEIFSHMNSDLNDFLYYSKEIERDGKVEEIRMEIMGWWTSYNSFYYFCNAFNKFGENKDLFKNVPNDIKKDCENRKPISKKLLNLIEYYDKKDFDNVLEDEKENIFSEKMDVTTIKLKSEIFWQSGAIAEKKKDWVVVRYYNHGKEYERIYYTKDKIYKMKYNILLDKFVSTKSEKMGIYSLVSRRISIPFCSFKKKYYGIYNDKKYEEFVSGTILKRYICVKHEPNNTYGNYFFNIEKQSHYLFMEQLIKQDFHKLYMTFLSPLGMKDFQYSMLNVKYNKKKFKNFTLRTLSTANLNDIFFCSGKHLKYLDKNMTLSTWREYIKRINAPWIKDNFSNIEMMMKICQLDQDEKKIRQIIKVYAKNGKNYEKFFYYLLKDKSDSEISRLMQMYCDYWIFRDKANVYNQDGGTFHYPLFLKPSEIEFMHNMAYRDYAREEDKRKNPNRYKKFLTRVQEKDYTQFEYSGDEKDKYAIILAKEPTDLDYEGKVLSHCVGGYINAMINGDSYIYFLRKKDNLSSPYYTIELRKIETNEKGEYSYEMTQCYGEHDTIKKSVECEQFIKKWCKVKHIKINCYLR